MRAYTRSTSGVLYDAAPLGVYAVVEASAGVARVTMVGATDSGELRRTFDLGGGETAWLPAGAFESIKLTCDQVGGSSPSISVWWGEDRPRVDEGLRLYQRVSAGAAVVVPQGARRVIARVADAGAVWGQTLSGLTDVVALPAAAPFRCLGDTLTLSADNTLFWLLEV